MGKITRLKLKGNHRLKSNPKKEPNFYEMCWSINPLKLDVADANDPFMFLQDSECKVQEGDENSGLDFFVKEIESDVSNRFNSENTPN
ncbi:MAG: hypothetical protein AB8G05_27195 [Oligoflexales bacterium]